MARKRRIMMKTVAARLVHGQPMSFALRKDGTLAIIGPDGRKSIFTADQVRAASRVAESSDSTKKDQEDG